MGYLIASRHNVARISRLYILVALFFFAGLAGGQVAPGTPSFSAYDRHEVDTIDLLNNNIFFNIPVLQKSGAFPFRFSLQGNSYVAVDTTGTWAASLTGINSVLGSANGYLGTAVSWAHPTATQSATCPGGGSTTKFMDWVVTFSDGTVHALPTTDYTDLYGSEQSCLNASFSDQTIDGSGYTVNATRSVATSVYDRSGFSISETSITDPNNNSMTFGSVPTTYTDTLGETVMTVAANLWPQNTYTWTNVNGGNPQVAGTSTGTVTVRSVFGCAGKSDYNYSTQLLSGFSFPDGTSFGIAYEGTPTHTGDYTGRVAKFTLREGGTVTYSYLGGSNNGINCTYQTVPELKRVTSAGTTTYTLAYALVSGSNYKATNTVVDSGGNETVYTFTGLTSTGNATPPVTQALTETQYYVNIGTVSSPSYSSIPTRQDVYCYNAGSGQPGNWAGGPAFQSPKITSTVGGRVARPFSR